MSESEPARVTVNLVQLNDYHKNSNSVRICVKEPEWTYIKVSQIITPPLAQDVSAEPIDLLTWKSRILAAQTRYLGLVGSAIQVDLLHLEGEYGEMAVLRVPRENAPELASALGDWVGEVGGRTVGFRLWKMTNFIHGVFDTNEDELFR